MRNVLIALTIAVAGPMACAPADPPPATAERVESFEATAQVLAIDRAARQIVMRADTGETIELAAGPEIRNFDQIEVGDVASIRYARATLARMAEAGEAGRTTTVDAARALQGARPAAAAFVETDVVVEVVSYDPATGAAVVRNPEGQLRSFTVHPDMRAFAEARKPGDRVRVQLVDAVALSIEPRE